MPEHEDRLRRLAINDARTVDAVLRDDCPTVGSTPLGAHARSLVRLGVLVALDGPESAFDHTVAQALASGATAAEIVDVLSAAAPLVGSAHVVAAAPRVARALGYDVDAALERLDPH